MRFRKLKLVGFKSFVEPAEMLIEPGLTGIVGPNGCGKSNLLEALRWVMGENSSKSMRASAMDDVIFNGSAERPARSMAEVQLTLDNSRRTAPPPWKEFDTIEVSRRIMREKGSTYRINGREVRARDVQLLFADAGTGARSPALVRQGRISELINARPQARRRLLEEAAGIVGLYTRRHEAELKLSAAEQNLERLEDVLLQLQQQVASLTRQARQAARYRELSGSIRAHEAALLWRLWHEAAVQHQQAESALAEATKVQADAVYQASLLGRELELAKEKIAPLREESAGRAAAVQRLKLELEGLGRQEKAAQRRMQELAERIEQARQDMARMHEDAQDAEAALARLQEELQALQQAEGTRDTRELERLQQQLHAALKVVAERQQRVDALQAQLAERGAQRGALQGQQRELENRLERLRQEQQRQRQKRAALQQQVQAAALDDLQQQVQQAQATLQQAEEQVATLQQEEQQARDALEQARAKAHERERAAQALKVEIAAIEKMLGPVPEEDGTRLLDALEVEAGFETALAAALGEDLEAGLDEQAAAHWRALPPLDMPALPGQVSPLADHVKAPEALARRLAAIGVVESAMAGHATQPLLKPGQRLVSREGDVWRWDGFVAAAEAPTAAARRLQARNRLAGLQKQAQQAEAAQQQAEQRLQQARAEAGRLQQALNEARQQERAARKALDEKRRQLERAQQQLQGVERDMVALQATLQRLEEECSSVQQELRTVAERLAALPPEDDLRQQLEEARAALDAAREHEREARLALDAMQRRQRERQQQLQRLQREQADWQRRQQRAARHEAELKQRLERLQHQQEDLARTPDTLGEKREKLFAALKEAEKAAKQAADVLAEAEQALLEKDRAWREAENRLSEAKAAHAAAQARQEATAEKLREALSALQERLQCRAEHALMKTPWSADDCPERNELEAALAKARAARERLGAVNLRAEVELKEAQEELEKLTAERDDVQQAVDKLRGAIANLNREGRKRLLEAFEQVNRHFAALFTTLFGGGKAHLELIESDDPLEAGLEIFAQPPGKRLQTLSLLSGGEQTLTALALIFAVFLVNPSPICVLDEVDAPLDEHNVERFCNLLDDMLKRAPTDFLIITHHPLTMARMHRLYGVTMMEPGVSRLVSVDLQTAERLREAS